MTQIYEEEENPFMSSSNIYPKACFRKSNLKIDHTTVLLLLGVGSH
jgi:hypothetical protein